MTVTADAKKRVPIRSARPGDRFDVQVSADRTVVLMPLVPKDEVPVIKPIRTRHGWLMFPPGRGPDRAAIRAAIRTDRYRHQ